MEQVDFDFQPLKDCCCETIASHVRHNPMMMCISCRCLIKCFREETEFRNYALFCESRGRDAAFGRHDLYFVIVLPQGSV